MNRSKIAVVIIAAIILSILLLTTIITSGNFFNPLAFLQVAIIVFLWIVVYCCVSKLSKVDPTVMAGPEEDPGTKALFEKNLEEIMRGQIPGNHP